jgi:hypothetical protein
MFAMHQEKTAQQNIFWRVFFRRALWKRRTAKHHFAVRLNKCARQRFVHTAYMKFPVVFGDGLSCSSQCLPQKPWFRKQVRTQIHYFSSNYFASPLTIQVRLDVSELMHSGATKVDKFFRHPAPSPRRCSISTLKRTVMFRHIYWCICKRKQEAAGSSTHRHSCLPFPSTWSCMSRQTTCTRSPSSRSSNFRPFLLNQRSLFFWKQYVLTCVNMEKLRAEWLN